MTPSEFSRPVRLDMIGAQTRAMQVEADERERTAIARRFGLTAVGLLKAEVELCRAGDDIVAAGRLSAEVVQACVATDAPVPSRIEEGFALRFRPEGDTCDEDLELAEDELDTILFEGASIDVGEAVAQTLALALDPYPRAEGAREALGEAGVMSGEEAGPFGGLAALRDKLGRQG